MHDIHGNKGHCAKVKGHNAKVSVEAAKVTGHGRHDAKTIQNSQLIVAHRAA